jgi:glycosyltransferase involved in cell wall biosynthesis
LEKIKGVQVLIPIFRSMAIDLVIAGTGTFERELCTMAAGAANIKFLGRVGHQRLHGLYRHAVATLVPSLCYETFGLVVAESFAAETPVIVYAQSSLAEIVGTYGGGLSYRTSDELRDALHALLGDPALRQRLGREGRKAYEAEFAEDAFLRHYLDVVRTLLARKRDGQPLAGRIGAQSRLAGRQVFLTASAES